MHNRRSFTICLGFWFFFSFLYFFLSFFHSFGWTDIRSAICLEHIRHAPDGGMLSIRPSIHPSIGKSSQNQNKSLPWGTRTTTITTTTVRTPFHGSVFFFFTIVTVVVVVVIFIFYFYFRNDCPATQPTTSRGWVGSWFRSRSGLGCGSQSCRRSPSCSRRPRRSIRTWPETQRCSPRCRSHHHCCCRRPFPQSPRPPETARDGPC
mmetsp:Transcript_32687/g.77022  ORF Transcript_32687/g.77022 Transcript_32687/m.77022 type:complete len:206 (-) Transcript_32687:2265-2882(-)